MSGFTVQNCHTGNLTVPGIFTFSTGKTFTAKNNVYRKNFSNQGSVVMTIFRFNKVIVDSCIFDSNKIDIESRTIGALAIVQVKK